MGVLDKVRDGLRARGLRYTEEEGTITVPAGSPGGFAVWITESLVVGFEGWHEHFDTEDAALSCLALGLSDQCRMKVTSRGGVAYRWRVERLEDGAWGPVSMTGSLFYPFWRARRVEYRRNRPTGNGTLDSTP